MSIIYAARLGMDEKFMFAVTSCLYIVTYIDNIPMQYYGTSICINLANLLLTSAKTGDQVENAFVILSNKIGSR